MYPTSITSSSEKRARTQLRVSPNGLESRKKIRKSPKSGEIITVERKRIQIQQQGEAEQEQSITINHAANDAFDEFPLKQSTVIEYQSFKTPEKPQVSSSDIEESTITESTTTKAFSSSSSFAYCLSEDENEKKANITLRILLDFLSKPNEATSENVVQTIRESMFIIECACQKSFTIVLEDDIKAILLQLINQECNCVVIDNPSISGTIVRRLLLLRKSLENKKPEILMQNLWPASDPDFLFALLQDIDTILQLSKSTDTFSKEKTSLLYRCSYVLLYASHIFIESTTIHSSPKFRNKKSENETGEEKQEQSKGLALSFFNYLNQHYENSQDYSYDMPQHGFFSMIARIWDNIIEIELIQNSRVWNVTESKSIYFLSKSLSVIRDAITLLLSACVLDAVDVGDTRTITEMVNFVKIRNDSRLSASILRATTNPTNSIMEDDLIKDDNDIKVHLNIDYLKSASARASKRATGPKFYKESLSIPLQWASPIL